MLWFSSCEKIWEWAGDEASGSRDQWDTSIPTGYQPSCPGSLIPRPYSGLGPLHYLWLVSCQMRSGNETNLWLDLAETLDHDHTLVY